MNCSQLRRKLIEEVAKSDTFNMHIWRDDCGTPRCIGGHLTVLIGGQNAPRTENEVPKQAGMLQVPVALWEQVCNPVGLDKGSPWKDHVKGSGFLATREQAVAMLEDLFNRHPVEGK